MGTNETTMAVFPAELANSERFLPYSEMTITTEVDAGYVSDRRQELKKQLAEIERQRKHLKEPALESCRRIDAEAKRISEPYEAIVRVLDKKLVAWHQSQEQIRLDAEKKKREEEAAKLAAERDAQLLTASVTGDEKAIEAVVEIDKNLERLEARPLEIQRNTKTARSLTYLQQRWTFEIVDATLIPREFLVVDEVKLRKYVTAMKESATVPGVRFYQESQIGGR